LPRVIPNLPHMNVIKVKHYDIDDVNFDSKPLVILDDSEALGDDNLLQSIIAEANKALVDLPFLPDNLVKIFVVRNIFS
jgi:hypothetical protein